MAHGTVKPLSGKFSSVWQVWLWFRAGLISQCAARPGRTQPKIPLKMPGFLLGLWAKGSPGFCVHPTPGLKFHLLMGLEKGVQDHC